MARKRKKKSAGPAKPVPPPKVVAAPVPRSFWFGYEVAWPKLVAARVVLFGLLALDALLQIRHAPRYGTGFNVAQIPWPDALAAGRDGYAIGKLLEAYFLVLAAFGVATRVVVPCAAAIYAWLYFGSQLDSYQHHYLVAILLGISCFIPWKRPDDPSKPVRAWAVRLFLVQLGIMYLWAAISKLDSAWLDGHALASQLGSSAVPPDRLSMLAKVVEHTVGWSVTAWLVILTEFTLAATVWIKRAQVIAAPLGLALHLGIVLTGLEIGLFAWLMIAMYALVIPDRVWNLFADLSLPRPTDNWAVFGGMLVVGVVFAWLCRIDHATTIGILGAIIAVAVAVARKGKDVVMVGFAFAAAMVLYTGVDRFSTVSTDYYRLWGGAARRLHDTNNAERAYRGWVAIAPGDPLAHFRLGRVLVEAKHTTDGLAELEIAAKLGSADAQALIQQVKSGARIDNDREDSR